MSYTKLEQMILRGFKDALLRSHMPASVSAPNLAPPKQEDYADHRWAYWAAKEIYHNSEKVKEQAEHEIELAFLISIIEESLGISEAVTLATIEVLKVEGLLELTRGHRGETVISREGLKVCRTFANETE